MDKCEKESESKKKLCRYDNTALLTMHYVRYKYIKVDGFIAQFNGFLNKYYKFEIY